LTNVQLDLAARLRSVCDPVPRDFRAISARRDGKTRLIMAYASDSFANSGTSTPVGADKERVTCATPSQGKAATRIPRWKYEALRRAIRHVIVSAGSRGATLDDLVEAVPQRLTADELADLGSVPWHVTTVKLDLEVKGEIQRVAGETPMRHVRILSDAA
jgi:hypothetical protein